MKHLLVVGATAIMGIGLYQLHESWKNIMLAVRLNRANLLVVAETAFGIGAARLLMGLVFSWHYPNYGPISELVIPLTLSISLLELRKVRRLKQLFPLSRGEGGSQSRNLQL